MEAAAGLVGQGLRQEAGVEAVAGRHGPDDLLEQEDVVGGLEGAGVVEVDLILAVAVLVMAVLGARPICSMVRQMSRRMFSPASSGATSK